MNYIITASRHMSWLGTTLRDEACCEDFVRDAPRKHELEKKAERAGLQCCRVGEERRERKRKEKMRRQEGMFVGENCSVSLSEIISSLTLNSRRFGS